MPWLRLDDQFSTNAKILAAGKDGRELYFSALGHAARNLTDGFIDARLLRQIAAMFEVYEPEPAVKNLVDAGLWEVCEGGWRIHDYLEYNPSREEVQFQREIIRRRQAMNTDPDLAKQIRDRDGNTCRYCGCNVNWRDRKSESGGTYDHVIPISQGGTDGADNIVVSCRMCNTRKGARTPEQAGMTLRPVQNPDEIKLESRQPVPDPVPVPLNPTTAAAGGQLTITQGRKLETDPDVAHLFTEVERAGVLVGGQHQDEQWRAVLEVTRDHALISEAFADVAATSPRAPTPKLMRTILERCMAEGCRPGEWRGRGGQPRASPGASRAESTYERSMAVLREAMNGNAADSGEGSGAMGGKLAIEAGATRDGTPVRARAG